MKKFNLFSYVLTVSVELHTCARLPRRYCIQMRRSKDNQNSQNQTFDSDSASGPATSDQASDMQWVNNSRSRYRGSGKNNSQSGMPWNYLVMRLLRMKLLKVLLILSILAVALYLSIGIWTEFGKDKGSSLKSERVKMQVHEEDRVLDGMNRGPQVQHKNSFDNHDNVNINQRVGLPGFGDNTCSLIERPQQVQQHEARQQHTIHGINKLKLTNNNVFVFTFFKSPVLGTGGGDKQTTT